MTTDGSRRGGVLRRAAAVLLLVPVALLGVLLLGAGPAAAHAVLESSDPAQGSQLAAAPANVTLTFSEEVGLAERSLQVTDPRGRRVDDGKPAHADGDPRTIRVELPAELGKGSYTVSWRVVSADGHPASGTFAIGVGVPAGTPPSAVTVDPAVSALRGLAQLAAYAGSAVIIGASLFLFVLWKDGQSSPRLRRLLVVGVSVAGAGAVAGLFVAGPYIAGRGLGGLFDPGLLGETASSSYGRPLLLRVLAVALSVPVLGVWPRVPDDADAGAGGVAAVGNVVLLAASFALTGHAAEAAPRLLAEAADGVHLVAAGLWLGGLAVLVTAFLPEADGAGRAAVLPRWSRIAAGCVAVLVGTGTYQAWREVTDLDALAWTTYGRILAAKLSVVAVLLVVAGAARLLLVRGRARRLGAVVSAEAVLGLVVLGVTSFLVATPPSRVTFGPPFTASLVAQDVEGRSIRVALDVTSTRSGPQSFGVKVFGADGASIPYQSVIGLLAAPGEDGEPGNGATQLTFVPAADGTARVTTEVSPAGRWRLTVHVLTDPTTDYAATTIYTVH